MNYERKVVTKQEERDIVTGMIVSTPFLQQCQAFAKPELLTLSYARVVAQWCLDYFNKYQKAPLGDIKGIETNLQFTDDDKREAVTDFIQSLSDKFDGEDNFNVGYGIDKAIIYFKGLSLVNLTDKIRQSVIAGDYEGAEAEVSNYKRVQKNVSMGIDVWHDKDAICRSIRNRDDNDVLFQFPGELGKLVRPFRRRDFAAIVAPGKRGKSFVLTEVAFLCSLIGLNVLFFSFEMPEEDILLRIYQRITGQVSPVGNDGIDSKEIMIPYFSGVGENVEHFRENRKIIDIRDVFQKVEAAKVMVKSGNFKLECAPSGSMSISDIINKLDNLEHYDGFIPDVIISDYADITRPESRSDKRHQLDEIWLGYRFISQNRNCLVFTASHSNKSTLERDIRQGDVSEDYRKLNHVTWMGGLNQTDEENDLGIMRMCVLADRYQRFNGMTEAKIIQCLDIGQVCLDSRIVKK